MAGELNPDTAGSQALPANYAGLAKRLDALEALIGTAADTAEDETVFGKIAEVLDEVSA